MTIRFEQYRNDRGAPPLELWESLRELENVNKQDIEYAGLVTSKTIDSFKLMFESNSECHFLIIVAKDVERLSTLGFAMASIPVRVGGFAVPLQCKILDIYIAPLGRRKKIGTEFILRIVQFANSHGAGTISAFSDVQAIDFYTRLQFKQMGRRLDMRLKLHQQIIPNLLESLGRTEVGPTESEFRVLG